MKGGCCNVTTLSYIVAVFFLVIYALFTIILTAALVMYFQADKNDDIKDIPFHRLVILFITSLAILITTILLICGIKKKRLSLIFPFLVCMITILGLNFIHEIIYFIISLVKKDDFGTVIGVFVCSCIIIALTIALITPIYLLYKKLKRQKMMAIKTPDDYQPQCQANNNLHGGQI